MDEIEANFSEGLMDEANQEQIRPKVTLKYNM
jgi:hypothetical protein